MVVTRRQAINPDAYKPKYNEIPGLDASLNMGYRFYRNYCKGFVLCAKNAKSYSVNGKTFDHSGFVSLINNTTFVDFFMLLSMLNCEYTYIKPQNGKGLAYQYVAYRLFKIRDKGVETIKLLVSVDSAEYELNGVKGKFASIPFWKSDTIMVPLKEVCEALKAKVIYRPLDGTILISRFFEY
ncbi:MAG: hypothetical protein HGA95_00200 [Caldiserica bacterium]|nr:hypothetical protein [Caldisericota bacterium]